MKMRSQSATTRRALDLAIIGYGRLAREYYLPALSRMKDVRVKAVADLSPESLHAATKGIPLARVYQSYQQMFSQESLDAVLIASPPSSHLMAWLEARKNGVAAFVEKPFALTSQIEDLPDLSDSEAALMVNFNRRFWTPYQKVIQGCRNGAIGALRHVQFTFHTDMARWSTVTQHRLSPDEGGVLHDLGSQAIDLVCQIVNCELRRISGSFTSKRWNSDCVQLELEFAGGIQAQCDLAYDHQNRESLTVTGSAGSILLREPNMTPHVAKDGQLSVAAFLEDYAWFGYRMLFPSRRMLRQTIMHSLSRFVESLRSGSCLKPGYAEACANLRRLAMAAHVAESITASHGAND